MTKKRVKILAAGGVLAVAVVIAAVAGWYGGQRAFFRDAEIIPGSAEQDASVQALSEQLGIELDPGLEQHAWLLANRGRLVIHSGAFELMNPQEDGWSRNRKLDVHKVKGDTAEDNLIHIYTDTVDLENSVANLVFIDSGMREYDGMLAVGMNIIVQWRSDAGTFDSGQRGIHAVMENGGFWSALDDEAYCYLHSAEDNWAVKRMSATPNLCQERFPSSFIGCGGNGKIDLIQLCGRIIFSGQSERWGNSMDLNLILGRFSPFRSDDVTLNISLDNYLRPASKDNK